MAPPRGPRRRAPPAQSAPILRVGLINVNGLLARGGERAVELAALAAEQQLDVLLLSETHLADCAAASQACGLLDAAMQELQQSGWVGRFSPAPPASPSSGVAVLVRERLVTQGEVQFSDWAEPADARQLAAGRAATLRLTWGGHTFQLLSAYLPSGDPAGQAAFIDSVLQPLHAAAAAAGTPVLWGGDWNFTADDSLDRHRRPGSNQPAPSAGPTARAKQLAACCPGLADVFRQLHPGRRAYTYLQGSTPETLVASRLDRFYLSPDLLPYVPRCTVVTGPRPADHRMVVLSLQAALPGRRGPGLRRVRVHYTKHPHLVAQVDSFLAQQQAPAAGVGAAAIYTWWAALKQRWRRCIAEANAAARAIFLTALRKQHEARVALDSAEQAAAAGTGDAAALAAAQRTYSRARAAAAGGVVRQCRLSWLHSRETPSKPISAVIKPPAAATAITALREVGSSGSRLVSGPAALPAVMARHWAAICTAPQPTPAAAAAQAQVLQAVRAHSAKLAPASAAAAGNAVITAAEVEAAICRLPPGSAPGPDGIPVDAYRKHASLLAPLLACVFTSMGQQQQAPADFLLGAISFFYKKGERCDPSNYRPITLLGADYRVLARALATRFGGVMGSVISPAQTAFLPGRRMGATVQLLRLLPPLLRAQHAHAVMVFMDFAKAYDTVDRSFLLAVMGEMGAGGGMAAWVRTLLSDTQAVAVVNGHVSPPAAFTAGVRQGCPLSPLLYLFVAEALLAWLTQQGHGIDVAGAGRLVAGQYADDCTGLLPSLQRLPAFQADMKVFGAATNQHLNAGKTQVMLVGELPSGPAPTALPGGLTLVKQATTLGVTFSNSQLSATQLKQFWEARLAGVFARFDKLANMPLSAFGRGFGGTGYGISQCLYHMEFMGLPPSDLLDQLVSRVAALVDRKRRSYDPPGQRCLTGVGAAELVGSPKVGGFGVLPLRAHVHARHAWWAISAATAVHAPGPLPPWVRVLRALLEEYSPGATPLTLLASLRRGPSGSCGCPSAPTPRPGSQPQRCSSCCHPRVFLNEDAAPCPALVCLSDAVREVSLRLAATPGAAPMPPALARHAPLKSNPLLYDAHGLPLEVRFPLVFCDLFSPPTTVQQFWTAADAPLRHAAAPGPLLAGIRQQTQAMLPALPAGWVQLCGTPTGPGVHALQLQAEAAVLARLQLTPAHGASGRPWCLHRGPPPVKYLTTAMQPDLAAAARLPRQRAFLQAAAGPGQPSAQLSALLAAYKRLWRLKWENEHKEVFWRLALDGVPIYGMARYTGAQPALTCWCGAGAVGRDHCFWECPVAQCVRRTVGWAMPAGSLPTRANCWLCQPPALLQHQGMWDVVALSALRAMNVGRRRLEGFCVPLDRERKEALRQPTAPVAAAPAQPAGAPGGDGAETSAAAAARGMAPPPPPPAPQAVAGAPPAAQAASPRVRATRLQLEAACVSAVEACWEGLRSFASANPSPPDKWPALPAGQRLFQMSADGQLQAGPGPPPAEVAALVAAVLQAHDVAAPRAAAA